MTTETLPSKPKSRHLPLATTPAELGLGDQPVKARPGDSPGAHVRAQLDVQLRELLAREAGTRSGVDPEDLHQMRVALRRMRSILKLSGTLLGPGAEQVRAELGWLGQSLGEVRDHDVLIGHLREIIAGFEVRDQQAGRQLVAKFVAERGVAKRRLTRVLASTRYTAMLRDAAKLVTEPAPEVAVEAVETEKDTGDLVTGLRKPVRKLEKAVAALPQDPPDDDLHALRILDKRLRYTAELAKTSVKKKHATEIGKLIKATKDFQTVLGDHQDACVAADRMRSVLASVEPEAGFIAGRIAERELVRRAQARAEWPSVWAKVDSAGRAVIDR